MLMTRITGLLLLIFVADHVFALEPETGPVVSGYGPVYDVPGDAWNLDAKRHYKVSMDVSATGEFSGSLNRRLESAARFLNMHARSGIDPKSIEFVIVVHGSAGKDMLTDDAYKARFDVPNPNTMMLKALHDGGVKIYLCGQTAAHRGFAAEELNPAVSLAVSAMTAHVRLQSEGFTLIPF